MAKEIDAYKYWMDQLVNRSPNTVRAYKLHFRLFLEYVKLTPNQLIEMQRKAIESNGDPRENHVVESKVRAWLGELKTAKSPATCRLALSALKSFFELNLHPLRLTRLDRPQGDSLGSRIPEREEIVLMLDASKWKYRASIMALKDSGLRVSDLVRLRWEDKVDMGDGFWNFNLVTEKRKVVACAFIGPETTRLLENFKTKTGRIFDADKGTVNRRINKIIEKAGVEGVSAHGLRKFFVTSMEHARVPKDYYLHMMGKKSSVYSEKRLSELFKAYRDAYLELNIYAGQTDEQITELRDKLQEKEDRIKLLEEKQNVIPSLLHRLKTLEEIMKDPEKYRIWLTFQQVEFKPKGKKKG